MLLLISLTAALAQGIGMEQALANAGPAAMIADPRFAIVVAEVIELEARPFTNGEPPAGTVQIREALRGDVKLEKVTVRWRPYPHGFDTPNPEGVKKWQGAAFEGAPAVKQTYVLIGWATEGHFEVIPRGQLPGEKRAWVVQQLAKTKR